MKLIEKIVRIETPRLVLRQWVPSDFPLYAATAADEEVMEYFPQTLNKKQSDKKALKMQKEIAKRGWGFWAVEEKATQGFIGLTGLNLANELPFSPCVEVGWQYAKQAWGKGYASEAAKASLSFAFTELELDEVVSFTAEINWRSRAVMERIGMRIKGTPFPHPAVADGNPLKQHVLYHLRRDVWLNTK